jgi:hypothetical protein
MRGAQAGTTDRRVTGFTDAGLASRRDGLRRLIEYAAG